MQDGVARRCEAAGVAGACLHDEAVLEGPGEVGRVLRSEEVCGAVRLVGAQVAAEADEGGDDGGEEGAGAVEEVGVELVDPGSGVAAAQESVDGGVAVTGGDHVLGEVPLPVAEFDADRPVVLDQDPFGAGPVGDRSAQALVALLDGAGEAERTALREARVAVVGGRHVEEVRQHREALGVLEEDVAERLAQQRVLEPVGEHVHRGGGGPPEQPERGEHRAQGLGPFPYGPQRGRGQERVQLDVDEAPQVPGEGPDERGVGG